MTKANADTNLKKSKFTRYVRPDASQKVKILFSVFLYTLLLYALGVFYKITILILERTYVRNHLEANTKRKCLVYEFSMDTPPIDIQNVADVIY